MNRTRLLVVGAGVTGLAAALAATRAGVDVVVAGVPTGGRPGDVHVNIPPTMLRDLVWLGVGADSVRSGFPYRGVSVVGHQREVFRQPTPAMAGPAYPAAVAMTLTALTGLLAAAVRRNGGTTAPRCESVVPSDGRVLARFVDGTVEHFDLVVGADGAASGLRRALFDPRWSPQPTGHAWWQASVRRPRGLDRPRLSLIAADGGRSGVLPVGADSASVFLVLPAGDADAVPAHRRALLMRDRLLRSGMMPPDSLGELEDGEAVLVRRIHAGLLPGPWHRGRVLLVGEAAHVVPPQLGHPAAQCIEDAVALGLALRDAEIEGKPFDRFMALRLPRCRVTLETSLQAALWELRPDATTDLPAIMERQEQAVAEPLFATAAAL